MKKEIIPLETKDLWKLFQDKLSEILRDNKVVIFTVKGKEKMGMSAIGFGMMNLAIATAEFNKNERKR